jgi:fluoroacetyl-CoA thioesterase
MRPIPIGAKGSFTLVVGSEHLASQVKDAVLPPVLATPVMVMMMENAALNAIRAYFDPGETSVGSAVDIRHLAATPVGHHVRAEAAVTKVEGRRVSFTVSARDEKEEIGAGTHERAVIDIAKFRQRLKAKEKAA